MRKFLLAGSALVAFGLGSAAAADLPTKAPRIVPPPPPAWSGAYIGVAVGIRNTDADWDTTGIRAALAAPQATTAAGRFGNTAFRAGGFAGYNLQSGNVVYGFEGDFGYANNTDSHLGIPGTFTLGFAGIPQTIPTPLDAAGDSSRLRLGWDASIRGRFGYLVMPSVLLYATGGGAFQDVS